MLYPSLEWSELLAIYKSLVRSSSVERAAKWTRRENAKFGSKGAGKTECENIVYLRRKPLDRLLRINLIEVAGNAALFFRVIAWRNWSIYFDGRRNWMY